MLKRSRRPNNSPTIDIELLEEHLDCIKVSLLEIRGFRRKKIVKSPTFHFMQPVDIEEAWPRVQKPFRQAYQHLCHVADRFQVEHEDMPSTTMFGTALDQFVNLIDWITLYLEEHSVAGLSPSTLESVDAVILQVQQSINQVQRRVMVDFVFTRKPA